MDLETAANVGRCILDPETLQPYKEVKRADEGGTSLQAKKNWAKGTENGPSGAGLSSLSNKPQTINKLGKAPT